MSKKLLLPGWDSLSIEQKNAVEKWVQSLLHFNEDSRSLVEIFKSNNIESTVASDNNISFKSSGKVVSFHNTSENLKIEELAGQLPASLIDDFCEIVWCGSSSDPDCINKCINKLRS